MKISPTTKFIDLSLSYAPLAKAWRQSVALGSVSETEIPENQIGLVMIISRFDGMPDHGIFYLFIDGPARMTEVADMLKRNHAAFGDDLVLVDTLERFTDPTNAMRRAEALQEALPRANVIFPDLRIVRETVKFNL